MICRGLQINREFRLSIFGLSGTHLYLKMKTPESRVQLHVMLAFKGERVSWKSCHLKTIKLDHLRFYCSCWRFFLGLFLTTMKPNLSERIDNTSQCYRLGQFFWRTPIVPESGPLNVYKWSHLLYFTTGGARTCKSCPGNTWGSQPQWTLRAVTNENISKTGTFQTTFLLQLKCYKCPP